MSQVKHNIVANLLGRGWATAMGVLFVPLYIRYMGIEAYGLVGLYTLLLMLCNLLDLGLSATLNRELARRAEQPEEAQETRDLVRTLELIYWGVALVIAVAVMALAPVIANHWLRANQLPTATVAQAVAIMGLVLALRWPTGLYEGGLMGLQRQVLRNAISAGTGTLRGVGAVLILMFVSPSIQAFFAWQILTNALQTALGGLFLWRSLPKGTRRPRFHPDRLRAVWQFALGMTGISLVTLLLTQLDKIILSKILPLDRFGYYSLAGVVAAGLYTLIGPLFDALFPRFSGLVAAGEEDALRGLYHRGAQLMSVVILPAAIVLALFSPELLFAWTGDMVKVENTWRLVSLLALGTAMNGLMHLPYALQLAHGWTTLTVYGNTIALAVLAPAIVLMAVHFGAIGAASIWVVLNSAYVLVVVQVMHRRLLPREKARWYVEDVGLPLAATVAVAGLARMVSPHAVGESRVVCLGVLALAAAATLSATALATPTTRGFVWKVLRSRGLPVLGG